ncbi:hypothetical protein [Pseudoduganella buxea]|uniref:Uncharacterized protein n=1 Tax=Pseudoduganella buxea TaxID=1949069 RepID=A0A6I3T394_9BURK|nr:hypothetical protein [Pseudoduganella buxea]MTV54932.1 hypothetical protein [Pseudoduganella buxea]GGC23699.1 hypothetical protein GCM10011572_51540 [Pseudoduganella buxea]
MDQHIKELAVIAALNNMIKGKYFRMSVIDAAAKLLERHASGDAYDVLHMIDFVYFENMPVELRDSIPGLIQDVLGTSPIFRFTSVNKGFMIDLSSYSTQTKRQPWLRLTNR